MLGEGTIVKINRDDIAGTAKTIKVKNSYGPEKVGRVVYDKKGKVMVETLNRDDFWWFDISDLEVLDG